MTSQDLPMELLKAAVEGNSRYIIETLGLEEDNRDIQATRSGEFHLHARHLGNTIAHILVTNEHTELASKVLMKDIPLLKAQNMMLETPLHCAAKAGNEDLLNKLIQLDREQVMDSLKYTNRHGETALHLAAKHNHEGFIDQLMQLDPAMALQLDMEGMSPLHVATARGNTSVANFLLGTNPSLAYVPSSDGVFPVHVAARMGDVELLIDFIKKYPDSGEVLDRQERNILHYAALANKEEVFDTIFDMARNDSLLNKTAKRMIDAMAEEGNTPLHVAAMMGHREIVRDISWTKTLDGDKVLVLNNKGQSPIDLLIIRRQQTACVSQYARRMIEKHIRKEGPYSALFLFDRLVQVETLQDGMAKIQVVGLGSVLIATVTFAAAFQLPGGYYSDTGTPVLGRSYVFKAFVLADTAAFMNSVVSVISLILNALFTSAYYPNEVYMGTGMVNFAAYAFFAGGGCMVVAFGLGLYLVLAPISKAIAIYLLAEALVIGSALILWVVALGSFAFTLITHYNRRADKLIWIRLLTYLGPYMFLLLFIFLFAFL